MKNNDPILPRWPLRLLDLFCPDYLLEEIEGDLIQQYQRDVRVWGDSAARRRYCWNAIRFLRPGIVLRNNFKSNLIPPAMLFNYFKVATRVMLRNRAFSFINVSGLAIGIVGALLLFGWVLLEFRYDQFHEKKDRIYKAWNRNHFDGSLQSWDRTPRILAPTLQEEYPVVESAVSFANNDVAFLFRVGDKKILKNAGAYTDPAFLTMFSFPLVKGDNHTALQRPDGIVLTENFAAQLFGEKEAFGETVTVSADEYSFDFTVSGILKDLPPETDFAFDYLISYQFLENLEGRDTHWGNSSLHTYVLLPEPKDAELLNDQIRDIAKRHSSYDNDTQVFLYPFTRMHLYSRFENGQPAGGRIEIMKLMIILGISLIAIAGINFVNLSTARAQKRAREVGVRKVTGARRSSLVIQFLCESVLIAFAAGIIAVMFAFVILPFFNLLIDQQISFADQPTYVWFVVFGIILLIGLLSGLYPATYLSSFQPVRVLKGGGSTGSSNRGLFRKSLVVLQFGLAFMLIFSTVVVRKQIIHVQNRESGYDRNNLLYHFITGDLTKNYPAYREELIQRGYAESVTKTSAPVTEGWSNTWDMGWNGKDPESKSIVERYYVDQDFITTAGLSLVAGRDMDLHNFPSDSSAVILNEAAVKLMGFDDPIGEIIVDGGKDWKVIGVVEDFVLTSPYQKINPMALLGGKGWFNVIHIRLAQGKPVSELIAGVESVFKKYNPEYPFGYRFVDDAYRSKFVPLEKTLTITTVFSAVVIFIACLGLLGLSTYMIEARTKEIGIRKVFGGSVAAITRLLCGHSLKPIIIALAVASPLAWFTMNWWLQFSEYRISLNAWTVFIAWSVILIVASLTIIVQTIRAATVNPVSSLKTE